MRQKIQIDTIQSFAQNIVDTVREPLLILDAELYVHSANRAFYLMFHVSPEETEHRLIYESGNGQWDIPALRTLLEEIIPEHSIFNDFELEHIFPAIGRRIMLLNARKLRAGDHSELLVLAIEDVTEQRRTHDIEVRYTHQLQESYQRLQELENLFWVSDTGEGIPPEAFERIFEKFGQVELRQRGHKRGTGLGLTFCKLAVEAHGGNIKVDSEPDKGSTFSFTIPMHIAQLSARTPVLL